MKIAVIGPTYPIRGGISHYTTLMVRHLRERHEVLFISYSKQYPAFLFPGKTQIDDSTDRIEEKSEPLISFSNPLSWRRAARRIADWSPDVLVFSWVNPALAVQFRYVTGYIKRHSPRTKVVFWCHNVALHESLPMAPALTRFAFCRADRFIVTGRESADNLEAMRPGSVVSVVNLPSLDAFSSEETPGSARESLGLAPGAPVALYFGFVRQYKGLIHLLEAMPEVASRIPGVHLLVVGEFWDDRGPYDEAIERNGIAGKVTVVDRYVPNEEVARYFESADLVVLPYVSATGSGIVQIAFGFAKPVLTTSVGSLTEVVDDGGTGYVVPPADPRAIARAMVDFFESGRAEEFSSNVTAARGRFSWDSFLDEIERL